MTAARTPGPWVAVPLINGTVSIQSENLNGDGDYVATVFNPADVPLLMANQDLLAALCDFVAAAERGATNFFDMRGSCLRKARAAIAAARGQS